MKKSLHLKGLNGIRAIAALAVVISHITLALKEFNLDPYIFGVQENGTPKGLDLASYGVTLFFGLSGFLITFLLLLEKEKKEINIRHFYVRRILRIWPLYYSYMAISLAVIAIIGLGIDLRTLLFYIFFAPNIPFAFGLTLPFLYQYWSIGVEEQFYLFWPVIIKKVKKIFTTILVLTILLVLLKVVFRYAMPGGEKSIVSIFLGITRFQSMMIGAMGAILYYQKNELFIKIVSHKLTQALAWLVIVLLLFNRFHVASIIDNEIVTVVAVIIIIGQITEKNRLISLEGRVFDFLGKISYGLYIIHPLLIFGFALLLKNVAMNAIAKYILVYVSVVLATVFIAWLSYTYFENWFLKLKSKYAVIKTAASREKDDD
jgi:peptidoglycan/LPS O-acetylase OafA/YrhL